MTRQELQQQLKPLVLRIQKTDMPSKLLKAIDESWPDKRAANVERVFLRFGSRYTELRNRIIFECNKNALSFETEGGAAFEGVNIDFDMLSLLTLLAIAGRNDIESLFGDIRVVQDVLNEQGYERIARYLENGGEITPNAKWLGNVRPAIHCPFGFFD